MAENISEELRGCHQIEGGGSEGSGRGGGEGEAEDGEEVITIESDDAENSLLCLPVMPCMVPTWSWNYEMGISKTRNKYC